MNRSCKPWAKLHFHSVTTLVLSGFVFLLLSGMSKEFLYLFTQYSLPAFSYLAQNLHVPPLSLYCRFCMTPNLWKLYPYSNPFLRTYLMWLQHIWLLVAKAGSIFWSKYVFLSIYYLAGYPKVCFHYQLCNLNGRHHLTEEPFYITQIPQMTKFKFCAFPEEARWHSGQNARPRIRKPWVQILTKQII